MTPSWKSLWTIDELQAVAERALVQVPEAPPNGRVRAVPDERTIRYYTTLGLIDRPAAMQGRTALYGRRHLLQLIAIKRLQARGLSLAQLQEQLQGMTDAELERLARLPAELDAAPAEPRAQPAARASFWKEAPAPPAEPREAADLRPETIALDEDTLLTLLSPARPLDRDDLEAIRTVAAPLLELLEKRRLYRPRRERKPT
jgi:DNA-binding transcriptional MerR regulator